MTSGDQTNVIEFPQPATCLTVVPCAVWGAAIKTVNDLNGVGGGRVADFYRTQSAVFGG